MAGNKFGKLFTVTTFGESHGIALGCIVDGCPPGLELSEADIQPALDRRKPGTSRITSQRQEPDEIKILSGVFEGKTTGTPIGLIIENKDQKTKDYEDIKEKFRPGHGDFTYEKKYGIRDYRGGGRASARETTMRVAAGAIAQKYLALKQGIHIQAYLSQLGPLAIESVDFSEINNNPFFCPDAKQVPQLEAFIQSIRKEGDSIGAKVSVIARGVPAGFGEPVFDKLDADIAFALMGIPAAKGVEIGEGFSVITSRGSSHRDELTQEGFLSNHAGGILAGISSGQDIVAHVAFKPTSSILKPGRTVNLQGEETTIVTKGRHDPCVGIRAVPIVEAMMSLVLMDHALRWRAQCGDFIKENEEN